MNIKFIHFKRLLKYLSGIYQHIRFHARLIYVYRIISEELNRNTIMILGKYLVQYKKSVFHNQSQKYHKF